MDYIWIIKGNGETKFPSDEKKKKSAAIKWIAENELTGVLTKYPIDIPLFEWAIENKYFTPKNELQKNAKAIENFNSAYLEHYHFEKGK